MRANGLVAELLIGGHGRERLLDVSAVRVAIDCDAFARGAAEQLVNRHAEALAEDVPERNVHGGDRGHRDGPAPPIRTFVEVLPGIFNAAGVAADQQRADVIAEVTDNGHLAAVESGVAETAQAVFGYNFKRDEVSSRTADNDVRIDDFHDGLS